MKYRALTVGLTDDFFFALQTTLSSSNLHLTSALTVRDASRMLERQTFHLLIVDLEYLREISQINWLIGFRRITFIPVIVLSDNPEHDTHSMVQIGADMCVSDKDSPSVIADLALAQLRRYTEYNHYRTPGAAVSSTFQVGDILIVPARHTVEVRGRPVNLRPREFSLLLLFMQNPNIVLTPEQICEHAWGLNGNYNRGISQQIYLLRQAIEPNPENPIYIQTVYRTGYRFTADKVETCDICESSMNEF